MERGVILHADCLDAMATLDPESVSAVVTDPPYGLEFMGKGWDKLGATTETAHEGTDSTHPFRDGARRVRFGSSARSMQDWHARWAESAFRVAKPGAHLLAFGGTRTYHRLASAIEDAGWEIRDCLVWAYASGFPKSHNLDGEWDGWGTALKPAWEPIVMARKPLRGTVAANVGLHGTGALNIDGTRIPFAGAADVEFMASRIDAWSKQPGWEGPAAINVGQRKKRDGYSYPHGPKGNVDPTSVNPGRREEAVESDPQGRWPANVILTDPIFDGGIEGVIGGGETTSGLMKPTQVNGGERTVFGQDALKGYTTIETYGDAGTYSRFFLIPKADRAEREPIAGTMARQTRAILGQGIGGADNLGFARANIHPTVKPVDLMRHLVRLVTPPGGVVLDPFLGSGTTAIACEMEGFEWIGIEKEAEYVAIAEARLVGTQRGMGLAG